MPRHRESHKERALRWAKDIPPGENSFWRFVCVYAGIHRALQGKGSGADPEPTWDDPLGRNPAELRKPRVWLTNLANMCNRICAKLAAFNWFRGKELRLVEVNSQDVLSETVDSDDADNV